MLFGIAAAISRWRSTGAEGVTAERLVAEVVRAAVAPLYYRLFISGEAADATTAERAADAALAAARAGVFVRGVGGLPVRDA